MKALNKTAVAGFLAKKVGGEAAMRGAKKIPVVGAFVPDTKLEKVQGGISATKGVAARGRASMTAARTGAEPHKRVFGSRNIKRGAPPKIASSVVDTHGDMMELQKEAAHGAPTMRQIFGGGLAMAAGSAAMVAGVHGAGKLYDKVQTERIWKRLKTDNPDLTKTPQDRENFEVLQKFSPDIASNVTTARSYLQRAQQTYMAPHEFVKDLASVQDVRRKGGLGFALEDVASRSMAAGMDYRKLQSDHTDRIERGDQFAATLGQRGAQFDATFGQKEEESLRRQNQMGAQLGAQQSQFEATHAQRGAQGDAQQQRWEQEQRGSKRTMRSRKRGGGLRITGHKKNGSLNEAMDSVLSDV